MLQKVQLEKVLFLDIETVPLVYRFDDVDEKSAELFNLKTRFLQKEDKSVSDLYTNELESTLNLGKSYVSHADLFARQEQGNPFA